VLILGPLFIIAANDIPKVCQLGARPAPWRRREATAYSHSPMTTAKEVAVENDLAVRRLIARYCHLVDDRDFEAAADLFTDEARFRVFEEDLVGRAAIRAWFDTIPPSMFHHVTNVVVSNGSHPGTFHAVSDLAAGGKSDTGWSTWMLGRYHDTFVGEGRQLRFSQRIVTGR
jgi:ketosteroid isomerase-like protein